MTRRIAFRRLQHRNSGPDIQADRQADSLSHILNVLICPPVCSTVRVCVLVYVSTVTQPPQQRIAVTFLCFCIHQTHNPDSAASRSALCALHKLLIYLLTYLLLKLQPLPSSLHYDHLTSIVSSSPLYHEPIFQSSFPPKSFFFFSNNAFSKDI